MAKGVAIKFRTYAESVTNLLKITKFENELKKHAVVILKPCLRSAGTASTSPQFVEAVLNYCINHKNPETQIYIAEGSDGEDTMDMFEKLGYKKLAEQYHVSLIDLNNTDVETIQDSEFLKFESIKYPKILQNAYIISLPKLSIDSETEIAGCLSNMLGAFPARYYTGWFSKTKNKIRAEPIRYAIHDILRCKMPNTAIIDASEQGQILLGEPIEIEKQACKLLGKDPRSVQYLRLVDESFANTLNWLAKKQEAKAQKAEVIVQ